MKITVDVKNCAECMFSESNVSMHDEPFTSTPLLTHYVCLVTGGPDFIWYEDARKGVYARCPKKCKEAA